MNDRGGLAESHGAKARTPARQTPSPDVDPPAPSSRGASAKLVRLLRETCLQMQEGAFLGSEEDLLGRYEISRQTLRQAARVLENEQLLKVRRGVGGGYYVRRPTLETIARTAATLMRIRDISLDDIVEAGHQISPLLTRKAALSQNEAARSEIPGLLSAANRIDGSGTAEFISWDNQAHSLIARLAGNPVLELTVSILNQIGFEVPQRSFFASHPTRMAKLTKVRCDVLRAIMERDVEVAALYAGRGNQLIRDWLAEDRGDAGGRSGPDASIL